MEEVDGVVLEAAYEEVAEVVAADEVIKLVEEDEAPADEDTIELDGEPYGERAVGYGCESVVVGARLFVDTLLESTLERLDPDTGLAIAVVEVVCWTYALDVMLDDDDSPWDNGGDAEAMLGETDEATDNPVGGRRMLSTVEDVRPLAAVGPEVLDASAL